MILPKSNLPSDSLPWGRSIESQINNVNAAQAKTDTNLFSLTSQVNSIAANQGYAIPLTWTSNGVSGVVSNTGFFTSIYGDLGAFSFKTNGDGFLLTTGFNFQTDSTSIVSTDQASLGLIISTADNYASNGNAAFYPYGATAFPPAMVSQFGYTSASLTEYIPLPAGSYVMTITALAIAGSTTATLNINNVFASIQPIPARS